MKDDNMAMLEQLAIGKIQCLRTDLDDKIRSAEILLLNHMAIARAFNFLYPLQLPRLPEQNKQKIKEIKENIQRQQIVEPNLTYQNFIKGQRTTEPNITDNNSINDNKRKASLIT